MRYNHESCLELLEALYPEDVKDGGLYITWCRMASGRLKVFATRTRFTPDLDSTNIEIAISDSYDGLFHKLLNEFARRFSIEGKL